MWESFMHSLIMKQKKNIAHVPWMRNRSKGGSDRLGAAPTHGIWLGHGHTVQPAAVGHGDTDPEPPPLPLARPRSHPSHTLRTCSNSWTPTKHPPGFLRPPCRAGCSCIPTARGCQSWPVCCPPCLLLITHGSTAGMQKKVLPGKQRLVHTLPGLYPAARASLLDKKLLPTMDSEVPSALASVVWAAGRWGVCMAMDTAWHTKCPSRAQPPSAPTRGTGET